MVLYALYGIPDPQNARLANGWHLRISPNPIEDGLAFFTFSKKGND